MKDTGIYMVNVRQSKGDQVLAALSSAVALQYSPEYKIDFQNTNALDKALNEMGVSFIKKPSEVFAGELKDVSSKTDLTPYFLIISLILFFIDIIIRKLNISLRDIFRKNKENDIKVIIENVEENTDLSEKSKEVYSNENNNEIEKSKKRKNEDKNETKLDTGTLLNKKKNRYF
jgi:hypothetical protein